MTAMKILILLLTVFIISCGPPLQTKLNEKFDGKNINEIVDSIGYPEKEIIAPNGNKVYVFTNSKTVHVAARYEDRQTVNKVGNVTYIGKRTERVSDSSTHHYECTLFLEVDNNNTVINWRAKGNRCRSFVK